MIKIITKIVITKINSATDNIKNIIASVNIVRQ